MSTPQSVYLGQTETWRKDPKDPTGPLSAPTKKTPRQKARKTAKGRAHSHVPKSRWTQASAKKPMKGLPPLHYTRGPYSLEVPDYLWRLIAIDGAGKKKLMTEVETISWDDSSAVLSGSITFHDPAWGERLGIREGHKVRAEFSTDGGHSFTPCWTMRMTQPNSDLLARTHSLSLVSDMNRLAQSNDDFTFKKGKKGWHPGGWRVDEVIKFICKKYKIPVEHCPILNTKITNWHVQDQIPLNVIHTALARHRNHTGIWFVPRIDWRERLWIVSWQRPRELYLVGPQLLAATGSSQLDERFATALTVRTGFKVKEHRDKKGKRKPHWQKLAVDVNSQAGIKLYGFIHRNLYSPDATSNADARKEGKLFLHEIAKPTRNYTVSIPGLAFVKRLDAFKLVLPADGISKIVYVAEAHHTVDASSGYTTELVLDWEDPFGFDKSAYILQKLSDTAVDRARKPTKAPAKKKKSSKTANAHKQAAGKPRQQQKGQLGATVTPAPNTTTR